MTNENYSILEESSADGDAIEDIHAIAFGPGRFARTAFRLREGVPPIDELGFVAWIDDRQVGSVRFTAITIGETPALLLGPLAVLPAHKNRGVGRALVRRGLAAALGRQEVAVLLVGDLPYYGPLGFHQVPVGSITLPGPVDPMRILVAPLHEGALEGLSGMVRGG
ncbi:MAG: N-acetyltransferase [Hyphomicrobiales bacterium]|nr:N-acetyltransferase [Hyphomicrobiales bacterium]